MLYIAITRGISGQLTVLSSIKKRKLLYFERLTRLHPQLITKQIFIHRLYDFVTTRHMYGFVPDVYEIFKDYNLNSHFDAYVLGSSFTPQLLWKQVVKASIHLSDISEARTGLMYKADVERFIRVLNGQLKCQLYDVMKRCKRHTKALSFLIQLLALPTTTLVKCVLCDKMYTDIVYHIIMECQYLI